MNVLAGVTIFALFISLPVESDAALYKLISVTDSCLFSSPLQEVKQDTVLVAVLELDPLNVSSADAQSISQRLRNHLTRENVFSVIERQKMETILEEQGFQLSGTCNTHECVVEVGKILGARKMIAGSVSKVGNIFTLQVRIVDVESGQIENVADADERSIERLLTNATSVVSRDLADAVRGGVSSTQRQDFQPGLEESRGRLIIRLSAGPSFLVSKGGISKDIGSFYEIVIGSKSSGKVIPCFAYSNNRLEKGTLVSHAPGAGLISPLFGSNGYIGAFACLTVVRTDLNPYERITERGTGLYTVIGAEWQLINKLRLGIANRYLWANNVKALSFALSFYWINTSNP